MGKPDGLLRATVAADLDRYTIQVSDLITQVSDASLVHQTYGKYSIGTDVRQLLATLEREQNDGWQFKYKYI